MPEVPGPDADGIPEVGEDDGEAVERTAKKARIGPRETEEAADEEDEVVEGSTAREEEEPAMQSQEVQEDEEAEPSTKRARSSTLSVERRQPCFTVSGAYQVDLDDGNQCPKSRLECDDCSCSFHSRNQLFTHVRIGCEVNGPWIYLQS